LIVSHQLHTKIGWWLITGVFGTTSLLLLVYS